MIATRIATLAATAIGRRGLAAVCSAATVDECQGLRKHGKNSEAQTCYQALSQDRASRICARRAIGAWEMYQDANNAFRDAVAQSDHNANYRVRWGMLLHERFNNTDADNLFKEAADRDPKSARAYLGLALVSADGFDNDAIKDVAMALQLDPKLVEAHELFARLALEDSNQQQALSPKRTKR